MSPEEGSILAKLVILSHYQHLQMTDIWSHPISRQSPPINFSLNLSRFYRKWARIWCGSNRVIHNTVQALATTKLGTNLRALQRTLVPRRQSSNIPSLLWVYVNVTSDPVVMVTGPHTWLYSLTKGEFKVLSIIEHMAIHWSIFLKTI